jgi:hypothetical protein
MTNDKLKENPTNISINQATTTNQFNMLMVAAQVTVS